MNERIRELAKNYLVHEHYTRYGELVEEKQYEFYPDELEDFVIQIIRECAYIAKHDSDQGVNYNSGRTWASLDILKHFGIE